MENTKNVQVYFTIGFECISLFCIGLLGFNHKFLENGSDLQIKQLRQPLSNDYKTFFSGGEPNSMKNDYLERGDIEERDHLLLEKLKKRMTDEENLK